LDFPLDFDAVRRGFYTDQYFNNIRAILTRLAGEDARFGGTPDAPATKEIGPEAAAAFRPGDAEVEMQIFHKKEEAVTCGLEHALRVLAECTGVIEGGRFVNTAARLEVEALRDGDISTARSPVLRIRGRYRDFAHLETVLLGLLGRQSKIATNTFRLLRAGGGKPVMFFAGRFDLPQTQAADGYAYKVGVDAYNRRHGAAAPAMVATPAQASLWGGSAGGTTAHAFILCFLRDTTAAMLEFARLAPPETPRVALVDSSGDCVGDSLRTAAAFFERHWTLRARGRARDAENFRLFGVRVDTAEDVIDAALGPNGRPGVTPELTGTLRRALDEYPSKRRWKDDEQAAAARDFFRSVRIVASGGFDESKIARFEAEDACVDFYGVGSAFFRSGQVDHTADVVRVKVGGEWRECAKKGRGVWSNPDLAPRGLTRSEEDA